MTTSFHRERELESIIKKLQDFITDIGYDIEEVIESLKIERLHTLKNNERAVEYWLAHDVDNYNEFTNTKLGIPYNSKDETDVT